MKFLVSCATLNFLFFANVVSSSVNITANSDNTNATAKTIIYTPRQGFQMSCNVSADVDNMEVKWEKNGISISETEELKGRTHTKNKDGVYSLSIDKSTEKDVGNYSCTAYINNQPVKTANIIAASQIRVKTPNNVNVVEGEKLRIHCIILGSPPLDVSWTVGNETYKESSGRVQLLEDPEKKIPNSILLIEDIQMSDRGHYTCIVHSNITLVTHEHTSMVRIKDKYAALWPFLGICAEVFVLCAIILIYEKKRNKTELEESDTDQSPDQKNTPDHGKDSNLRHRQ